MINRLLRDDPSKGQTATKTRLRFHDICTAVKDPSMLGLFLIGLISFIPIAPVHQYLTLNLRHLGFSTFDANLLSIPADVLHVITVLLITWSSEYFNERTFHCIASQVFCLPLFATLLALPPHGFHWARFTIATLIAGAPNSFPVLVSWINRNSYDVKKRSLSITIFCALEIVGAAGSSRKLCFHLPSFLHLLTLSFNNPSIGKKN